MADNDDLDDLLDSALADFRKVDGVQRPRKSLEENSLPSPQQHGSLPAAVQGLGLELPPRRPGKARPGPAKGKGSADSLPKPSPAGRSVERESIASTQNEYFSDTLEKLAEQTRKTLESLETPNDEDALGERFVEDLVKQFEQLGGSQDMQSVMDRMMHQLLSKEVLHEPMKEIGERYPQWLEANRSKLNQDDFSRYSTQYALIKQLCQVYETSPDDFPKIVDLMQRMQECGQPPDDIVQELAPGLQLGQDGLPMLSELLPEGEQALGQNCSIM